MPHVSSVWSQVMAQAPSIEGARSTEPDDPDVVALSPPLIIAGAPWSRTSWLQKLIPEPPQCTGGRESRLLVLFDGMLSECRRKAAFPRPHGPLGLVTEEDFIRSLRKTWARVFEPILDDHPRRPCWSKRPPITSCTWNWPTGSFRTAGSCIWSGTRPRWRRVWCVRLGSHRAEAGLRVRSKLRLADGWNARWPEPRPPRDSGLDASRPLAMKISGPIRGNGSGKSLPSPASPRPRGGRPGRSGGR